MNAAPLPPTFAQRWQVFSSTMLRAFHAYASWLVSISWKRFIVLAVLLLIAANILGNLLTWRMTEEVDAPAAPAAPAHSDKVNQTAEKAVEQARKKIEALRYEIQIDDKGVRILPRPASGASAPADHLPSVDIRLPNADDRAAVREAVETARKELESAAREVAQAQAEAQEEAQQALQEAKDALREAEAARSEVRSGKRTRVHEVRLGDSLGELAVLWILASALIKATYKGRMQAEAKAAQATETAEAESLRRQVVEARMAAMQAQVEPHFLFNTLASIDHLIETDPPRASQMQRNLIALLRASMPTMREANANGGVRDLGREMSVIRPYLEILKMRMEERLQVQIEVPDGLLSAEFPPMMIQSLVENAIKHGLEPKAEGGSLRLKAEVVHGKLSVTVADTGLGFGRAATAGTGVGLANIRERLSLLFGRAASLTVTENQPSGTVVTITVPYRSTTVDQGEPA